MVNGLKICIKMLIHNFTVSLEKVSNMTLCRTKQSGELFCEREGQFSAGYDTRLQVKDYAR